MQDELIFAKSCSFEPFVAIATPVPQGRTPARGVCEDRHGKINSGGGKEFSAIERSAQNSGTIEVQAASPFRYGACWRRWLEREVEDYRGPLSTSIFRGGRPIPPTAHHAGEILRPAAQAPRQIAARSARRRPRISRDHRLGRAGLPGRAHLRSVPRRGGDRQRPSTSLEMGRGGSSGSRLPEVQGRAAGLFRRDETPRWPSSTLIDPESAGLGDYGSRENYSSARSDADRSNISATSRRAGRGPWTARSSGCRATFPGGDEPARVIHGDFRCDNMILPCHRAEVCWRCSTGSCRRSATARDFTYHLMVWRMPAGVSTGLAGLDLPALNIPVGSGLCRFLLPADPARFHPRHRFLHGFNMFPPRSDRHGIKGRLARAPRPRHAARWPPASSRSPSGLGAGDPGGGLARSPSPVLHGRRGPAKRWR